MFLTMTTDVRESKLSTTHFDVPSSDCNACIKFVSLVRNGCLALTERAMSLSLLLPKLSSQSSLPPKTNTNALHQPRGGTLQPFPSSNRKFNAEKSLKYIGGKLFEKSKVPSSNNDKQQCCPVSVGVMFDYIASLITH